MKKELEYEYYIVGEIDGEPIYKRVIKTVPIKVELNANNSTVYKLFKTKLEDWRKNR